MSIDTIEKAPERPKIKTMAVMRGVHFGCRDCGHPVFWFEARTDFGSSLQIIGGEEFIPLLKKLGTYDIKDLEGATCWVESDPTRSLIKFLDFTGL